MSFSILFFPFFIMLFVILNSVVAHIFIFGDCFEASSSNNGTFK